MSSLLFRNLAAVVTCNDADELLQNVDLYCEDGVIRAVGKNLSQRADREIDGTHLFCYPGLINTHHHLYQQFSRNLPQVHTLVRLMRPACEIVYPSVLLLGEVVMEPAKVVPYFGSPERPLT